MLDLATIGLGLPAPDVAVASDLELGLTELLEMLKTWSPYLQQMTARQDEILSLLAQPVAVVLPIEPSVIEPVAPALAPLALQPNLDVYVESLLESRPLLAERLAIADPRGTAVEWLRWSLVEGMRAALSEADSEPLMPPVDVLADLFH